MTSGFDGGRLLALFGDALSAARAAGGNEAEASFEGGTLGVTRFANSTFTQAGIVLEGRARIRAAVGRRIGAATTTMLDPASLAEAARRAVENARHQPETAAFGGFARGEGAPPAARALFVPETAATTPEERAAILGRVFARAAKDRLLCAGTLVTGTTTRAVATTGGVGIHETGTKALFELIALDGGSSGYGIAHGPALGALDLDGAVEEACRGAVRGRTVAELPPGALDVVLAPAAVAEALEWMASTSFSGRTMVDGTSLLAGRAGERLCGAEVTIRDDAGHAHPHALPAGFDAEGTAKRRVTFLRGGIGGEVVTDRAIAARLGGASSGHAPSVVDEGAEGPAAMNLVMEPGEASTEDLVARVERGVYVTRFHYVNGFLDTRQATMTGMTRDGMFLIENGKLGNAVPNLRWTESMLGAFGRLGGVGRELASLPSRWSTGGNLLCPALLVRRFTFTGRSR